MSRRAYRIFHPHDLTVGKCVELEPSAVRHLVTVLRVNIGQEVVLFNGDGFDYPARVIEVSRRHIAAELLRRVSKDNESPLGIHLVQAIARGDKMDWVLQKAVELGVSEITPVITERCGVKLDIKRFEKKSLHWQKVIESACEQSGRSIIPKLNLIAPIYSLLERQDSLDSWLHLDPHHGKAPSQLRPQKSFSLCIGPEGGFSDDEETRFVQLGLKSIRLGPRVLRTETAGLAAISVLQSHFGDI